MFHIIQVIFSPGTLEFILSFSRRNTNKLEHIQKIMKSLTAIHLADQKKKKKNASLENSKDGVLKFTQPKTW